MPSPISNAYLMLPPSEHGLRVRATCMGLKLPPIEIAATPKGIEAWADAMANQPNSVAVIDLERLPAELSTVTQLARQLPESVRARVLLTRIAQGPVWPSDRKWARTMGFADLFAEWGWNAENAAPDEALDCLVKLTHSAAPKPEQIKQLFSALGVRADVTSPRGLVRQLTGLSAEDLAAALASNVKSATRLFALTPYPSCKLATEMVDWLAQNHATSRAQAVSLGQALQGLGLLHHVVHEQTFADQELFFRMSGSGPAIAQMPHRWLFSLQQGASRLLADRSYRGTKYPQCFVGSEAVDWFVEQHQMSRLDAENALNRLHRYRLIEHVTGEHPVRDGHFFYRFNAQA